MPKRPYPRYQRHHNAILLSRWASESTVLADGEGHGAKRADRRNFHDDADDGE
jgi:hypothetical protein